MAEKTNSEVWGANFAQTSSTITFSKTDMATKLLAAGIVYTPSSSDSAEKTIIAIVQCAALQLNAAERVSDYTNRNVEIAMQSPPSITQQGGANWQIDTYACRFYKPFTQNSPSPDNY